MLLKIAVLSLLSFGFASAQSSASSVASSAASSPSSSATPTSNATLPKWNWINPEQKMHGVALGNWLLLERWMNYDWFIETSGSRDAADEWTWMQAVGDRERAVSLLTDHWNTWVTEEHIRNISESGFNHLRIPFGYWAFINATGTPYASLAGQQDQINRILGYAQQYGLYVMLDLHGLPGSQNGEQPSGRRGSNDFYGDANQALGDQTIDAIIAFVEASPYRSIISGLEACNEPVYYTDGQFQTLRGFYERSYNKLSSMDDPLPMIFHPGSPNSNPLDSWQTFINGKNASLLVFEIHPYIGRGQSLSGTAASEQNLIDQLCSVTQSYVGYGVPVAITEWSLTNPIVNDNAWDERWFAVQAHMYAQSGGGIFWNLYVNSSTSYDEEENISFYQYSFVDLHNRNVAPLPAANQTTQAYLESLENPCGSRPTQTWAEIVPSRTPQSTSTGRAQRRRISL